MLLLLEAKRNSLTVKTISTPRLGYITIHPIFKLFILVIEFTNTT
jgi:hypothetical protein